MTPSLHETLEEFPGGSLKGALEELAGVHAPGDDLVPVAPALHALFPAAGLRRGSTVAVDDATCHGATSLLIALLAEASRAGEWCAVLGIPELGAVLAAELGVALDRLAAVPEPGRAWPTVAAALLDGIDVVVVRPPYRPGAREMRRLTARARERGRVLVVAGPWEGAELRLRTVASRWHGVDAGHGQLRARELRVRAEGRGAAARPREAALWLPAPGARIEAGADAGGGGALRVVAA